MKKFAQRLDRSHPPGERVVPHVAAPPVAAQFKVAAARRPGASLFWLALSRRPHSSAAVSSFGYLA